MTRTLGTFLTGSGTDLLFSDLLGLDNAWNEKLF